MATLMIKSLLDEVTVRHGPGWLITKFLIAANREMRSRGVSLRLRRDLGEMISFNKRNQIHWYRLPPLIDPALNDIPTNDGYWIAGFDPNDEIVAVHAAPSIHWTDTKL